MPTIKYSFYRYGQLVHICYTKKDSDLCESYLIESGIEYELKVDRRF